MRPKIPCSVSLLTLNSAQDLPACLLALKDFAEIIVCDGNSTDGTQTIARAAGARVIKQYDTDEPNVRCATDKATVRQRAMDASRYPWRFFMDSDDTLSAEVVEEIADIVRAEHPQALIWRMPSQIMLEDTLVHHYAAYPAYQTRLVHQSVGARFKGEVHDHLVWDKNRFTVGTLRNHYTFIWPKDRVHNFWGYQKTYAERELSVIDWNNMELGEFLYWFVCRRLRILLGYILWRIPKLYLLHGFKNTMPLRLELMIAGYHALIFFGSIKKYFKSKAILPSPTGVLD